MSGVKCSPDRMLTVTLYQAQRYEVKPDSKFIKTCAVIIKVIAFPLVLVVRVISIPLHLGLMYLFRGYCPRCNKRSFNGGKFMDPESRELYDGAVCSACGSCFRFRAGKWEYTDQLD
jgi:hypothetical protein